MEAAPEHDALPWRAPTTWLKLAALAAGYFALAQLGLRFALSDAVASPIWPPAGLAVAAAVLWGRRALPAVFAGVVAVELSAGVPPAWSLVMAIGTSAEAAIGAAIVRAAGGRQALHRLKGVFLFATAALLGPVAAALTGTGSLLGAGIIPAAAAPQVIMTWYLGDVAGILVVAPALLLLRDLRLPAKPFDQVEAFASFLLLAVAVGGVFGLVKEPLAFLTIPPVVWLAARFGPAFTAWGLLGLDLAAVVATATGHGPFAHLAPNTAFLILQSFALTVSLLGLAVAAIAADRRAFALGLEQRVVDRTASLERANAELAAEAARRRRSQAQAEEAQRAAHVGDWSWDLASGKVTWSTELYRIYRVAADHQPTYDDYLDRVHPDDRARVQAAMQAALERGAPYEHDERVRAGDGTWRHLRTWGQPVRGADGALAGLAGACQDITDHVAQEEARRRAANELNESLERFRALAESAPIGIAHTTLAGAVDYANQTWSRITGIADHRDDELVRKAIHPDDQPRSWALWQEAARTGQPFQDDMRWVHPDGSVRYTNCRAVPTRGPDGALTGFVTTVEDITARRAAEQARLQEQEARLEVRRLREQADFKTNFLRTAAHELGTPLTPLKIQLRVLRDLVARRPDAEEARSVAVLERNVDRLQVLVKDLLESARLQSGRLRLNPRSMDLAHIVHDVVETFQEPAIQTGVALDAQVPNEIAMVGDPDRITQVLYNLLSNAMKFTPAGGRVHVVAEDLGEAVRLTVLDSGAGFSAEQASHLFQPFSQVHDPMQTSKPGSGLGLYICKGIVEQHGGGITAHSNGPGKGARFTVSLPRVARPPASPASAADTKDVAAKPAA